MVELLENLHQINHRLQKICPNCFTFGSIKFMTINRSHEAIFTRIADLSSVQNMLGYFILLLIFYITSATDLQQEISQCYAPVFSLCEKQQNSTQLLHLIAEMSSLRPLKEGCHKSSTVLVILLLMLKNRLDTTAMGSTERAA